MTRLVLLALVACGPSQQPPPAEPLPDSTPRWVGEGPGPAPKRPRVTEPGGPAGRPERVDAPPPPEKPHAESPKGDAAQYLEAHNKYRAKHCAPPLTWSKKLADVAQNWANQLKAKGCVFGHSGGMQYGENLGAGSVGALDPTSTVDMWYDEIKIYKFPNGGFSMNTGHFTQLVWRSTKQVGCGHVQCKGNDIYVCEYDPPGNWEGQYRNEVLPASCKK